MYLKFAMMVTIITILLFACRDELNEMDFSSMSIEEARTWFEVNYNPIMIMDADVSARKGQKPIALQNDWKHAFRSSNNKVEVVEVALRAQGRFGFASKSSMEKWRATKKRGYTNSLSRLVVIKDKKSGKIRCYIMTMMGDTGYLEKKKFQLWSNTYLKKDKDYSGLIFFHTVWGNFVNGWQMKDGIVTGKITQDLSDEDLDINITNGRTADICDYYPVYRVYEQCTDWYMVGEDAEGELWANLYDTDCEYMYEYVGEMEICDVPDNPNPDADPGGGGGSSGSGIGDYVPQSGDVFCNTGLPSTMPTQLPNTCVTSTMEYINNHYCGGSKNQGFYDLDYLQTYNIIVYNDGVSLSHINNFVNKHFDTEFISGLHYAIDNGWIVMTDIGSSIPNSSHNVAVVGYHSDGTLIYMDPEKGKLQEAPQTDFSMNYAIAISGCK